MYYTFNTPSEHLLTPPPLPPLESVGHTHRTRGRKSDGYDAPPHRHAGGSGTPSPSAGVTLSLLLIYTNPYFHYHTGGSGVWHLLVLGSMVHLCDLFSILWYHGDNYWHKRSWTDIHLSSGTHSLKCTSHSMSFSFMDRY